MKLPKICQACSLKIIPFEDEYVPVWSTKCFEELGDDPTKCLGGRKIANWIDVKSLLCERFSNRGGCQNPINGKYDHLPQGDTWEKRRGFVMESRDASKLGFDSKGIDYEKLAKEILDEYNENL